MSARITSRRVLRAALPVGIVGAVVGLAAAPALAATTFSVTANGSNADGRTLTSHTTLSISGHLDTSLTSTRTLALLVQRPDSSNSYTLRTKSVGPGSDATINTAFDTACPPWANSPCSPAANGTFTFTFTAPGEYKYFCSLHPHMTGAVKVE
jgi:plastocyanin